jgi:hypothetical protein
MFTTTIGLTAQGAEADFTLSRNTAQFKLTNALAAGDSLTAGTEFSKAAVQTSPILGGNIALATDAYLWFMVDKSASFVETGVVSDTLITVSKPTTNIARFTSNVVTAFVNLQVGDYVVIWSPELNANNRIEGRVNNKTNTTFDIKVTPTEFSGIVPQVLVSYKEGIVFLRTESVPQKIKIAAGSYNINTIAQQIENDLIGVSK